MTLSRLIKFQKLNYCLHFLNISYYFNYTSLSYDYIAKARCAKHLFFIKMTLDASCSVLIV